MIIEVIVNQQKMANKLLSRKQLEKISKKIDELFGRYKATDNQFEFMSKIINEENIIVTEKELGEDLSGMLTHDGNNWRILVNKTDSPKRKIFTIAHELAHYFLHAEKESDVFVDGLYTESYARNEAQKYKDQELEANEFAGCLIMPKSIIEMNIPKGETVEYSRAQSLADIFGVSNFAIITRLRNLGYEVSA